MPRTIDLITVSGSSQQEMSAIARVAKPIAPTMPGMVTPSEVIAVTIATSSTVIAALTILLAAMIRDRSAGGLPVCRIA